MDEQEKQKIDVQKAYNSCFKNLNDYITSQRRTEFQFMQEIIDFGMSEKAFIPTDDEILLFNDGLVICFDDRNNPACGISTIDAAGVFQKAINNMRISVRKAYPTYMQSALVHELGHTLGLLDSYPGGTSAENAVYSSDKRKTIMAESQTLTCDDADALANAIYLTMKNKDASLEDFEFQSLCEDTPDVFFRNGKQINRKPLLFYYQGKYYLTEFCKDGEIQSKTEVDFRDPQPLQTTLLRQCAAIPYQPQEPVITPQDPNKKYLFVNLAEQKRGPILANSNTVVYEYAPGIRREITFNNGWAKTLVKVKDEHNYLLYVYALLDRRQSFVFIKSDNLIFVYDTTDPSKYVAIQHETAFGNPSDEQIQYISNILKEFKKDRRFVYGIFESLEKPQEHFLQALRWQNYLKKYYPDPDYKIQTIHMGEKKRKKLIDELTHTMQKTGKHVKF